MNANGKVTPGDGAMDRGHAISLVDIRAAAGTIAGHVIESPMLHSPRLSDLTGARVHLKLENMQATGAFKERGGGEPARSARRGRARGRRRGHVGG